MSVVLAIVAIVGVSVVSALIFTPLARAVARRVGAVTQPSCDRWQKPPTPLFGGVAIFLATVAGLATAVFIVGDGWAARLIGIGARPALGLAASAGLMLVVGLVDDLVGLRPPVKFLLQIVAGVSLLSLGGVLQVTPWYVGNVVATLFWFVALTNAFNLLDGLDGIAAGVAAIAAFFLGLSFARQGAWAHAALTWALGGAALGFLRYNFHPASVFLGDAGSLFLGATLAGLVVTAPHPASASLVSVLFVPLAIVAVPLLDTILVAVTRTLSGRPISQGGLDHSTYRLIALGLTERQVALLLYAFAIAGGMVATLLTWLDHGLGVLVGTAFLVAMSLLAAYVGRIQSGPATQVRLLKPGTLLVRNLFYRRRLAEILLDVVLITLAYYAAYRLRFDGMLPPVYDTAFETTVGLVIALNILALTAFGVYRAPWEYAGIFDLYRMVGAILAGGVALFIYAEWSVPALAQSHSIIYVATLLTMAFVLASRLSFKSLELIRERSRKGARVLIYGADDGGELTLRELRNHADLGLRPVCFVDDDARRHGAEIHGVPIVAGFDRLEWVVHRYRIDKIVIGSHRLTPQELEVIQMLAAKLAVDVAEVGFHVNWLRPQTGTVAPSQASELSVLSVGSNGDGGPHGVERATDGGAARRTPTDLRMA
jgi:UDP-GlcNAc:undecaprenyl-phosphate/decaprenyl-phosphate GlcNAc-1-phosphate transferase